VTPEFSDARTDVTIHKVKNLRRVGSLERDKPNSLRENLVVEFFGSLAFQRMNHRKGGTVKAGPTQ
jgi:hypothetical protein